MRTRLPGNDHWAVVGDAMVSGSAFLDGQCLSSEALAERVSAVGGRDELRRLLARANGFFSAIHALPGPIKESIRRAYKRYDSTDAYDRDPRYGIVSEAEFDAISFRTIHYRPLLLLYLYDRGCFDLPGKTELDRALPGSTTAPRRPSRPDPSPT